MPARAARRTLPLKAKLFRGLGDPSRLAILETLRDGPKSVSRIVRETGMSQPNASMHLDCLWCCGLVDREADGRFRIYRLRSPKILRLLASAERLLAEVGEHIDACGRYADRRARTS